MYVLIIPAQVCPICLMLTMCSTACYNFDSATLKRLCIHHSQTNLLQASKHTHTQTFVHLWTCKYTPNHVSSKDSVS